ncbi:hypothetical protein ACQKDY_09750 [Alteromonas macleodii]|uniref:hypothetical protein n=1 Tax=Alteromonas macleodii TaxID=28108 RepID=UPI003D0858F6
MNPAKPKTIKKVIQAKIDDWLESLPEDLAKKLRKKVVVSGGCITSMLKGEPINDFDFYLKDQSSALAVAEYYCELHGHDGITAKIEIAENIKGDVEDRVIIVVSSEGVAGSNPDEINEADEWQENSASEEKEEPTKYKPQFISRNAITLSGKVQLITRFYGEVEDIHRNFDFIHATCSYDSETGKLSLPQKALESILSQSLYYAGSLYPIASIFRVQKFTKRGWRVGAGELLKIMWQISEIDMTDHAVLTDQLTGVDAAYMQGLIAALEDVDMEEINSDYVVEIINRIFNSEASSSEE